MVILNQGDRVVFSAIPPRTYFTSQKHYISFITNAIPLPIYGNVSKAGAWGVCTIIFEASDKLFQCQISTEVFSTHYADTITL